MLRKHFVKHQTSSSKAYLTLMREEIQTSKESISQLEDYLKSTATDQFWVDFITYLENIFESEETDSYQYQDMSQIISFNKHINELYQNFEDLNSTIESYLDYIILVSGKINAADVARGNKIMQYGFFNLDSDFIKDWYSVDYAAWGGFYQYKHDMMHLEVRDNHKNKAKRRLHALTIDEIKTFFKENFSYEYDKMFPNE